MARVNQSKPSHYAGAIQHYDNIPQRYQLATYAGHYRDDETWSRYVEEVLLEEYDSDRMRQAARLAGTSWNEHMEERGRHHALASPEDVDTWCVALLEDRAPKTCYEYYFLRIYDFYEYLKSDFQHPHLYNPVLLASIDYEAPRTIWMVRVERRRAKAANRQNMGE